MTTSLPASDVDVLLDLAGQFLDDEALLTTSRQWVANGERGVRHVRRYERGTQAVCSSFTPRPSVRLLDASIEQARQGSCCEDCLRMLAAELADKAGPMSTALFTLDYRAVDLLGRLEDAGSLPPTDLVRLRVQVQSLRGQLASYLASGAAAPGPARVSTALVERLDDASTSLQALIDAAGRGLHEESVRAAMVPPVTGAPWLASPGECQLLGFAAHTEAGPSQVLDAYLTRLRDGADPLIARALAVQSLLARGLRTLDQAALVPVDRVAATAQAVADDAGGAAWGAADAPTYRALAQAWHAYATEVAGDLVDRWDARMRSLTEAAGLVRLVVVSSVEEAYLDELLQVACAAACVLGPFERGEHWSTVLEVSEATCEALLLRVSTPGALYGAVYGERLEGALDARVLDTALALWTPWEPDGQFTSLASAVESAQALVAPAVSSRRVQVSARPSGPGRAVS